MLENLEKLKKTAEELNKPAEKPKCCKCHNFVGEIYYYCKSLNGHFCDKCEFRYMDAELCGWPRLFYSLEHIHERIPKIPQKNPTYIEAIS